MNQVVVVTGAARGIGLACAKLFLERGWAAALIDIDADTLAESHAELSKAWGNAVSAYELDVSQEAEAREVVLAIVKRYGRIDAWVNNAGVAVFKPILDTKVSEWQRVLDVNLSGPFICTQAAAQVMLRNTGPQKGYVVNIASISGLRASTLRVAYGTSKAALIHLTKQQAAELGNFGIRVNAIAPGPVDTAMAKAVHSPDIRAAYHDAIPLNRYGTEEEIAQAVVFLCSPQASYINGQCLAVDGGFDAVGIGLASLR